MFGRMRQSLPVTIGTLLIVFGLHCVFVMCAIEFFSGIQTCGTIVMSTLIGLMLRDERSVSFVLVAYRYVAD